MREPGQPETTPSERKPRRVWRLVVGVPLLMVSLGLAMDACTGFSMLTRARSHGGALAGIFGLGALYLLGEASADAVVSRDHITDPLYRRVLHLGALLGLWGACVLAVWLLYASLT